MAGRGAWPRRMGGRGEGALSTLAPRGNLHQSAFYGSTTRVRWLRSRQFAGGGALQSGRCRQRWVSVCAHTWAPKASASARLIPTDAEAKTKQRPSRLFPLPAYGNRAHGGSEIAINPSTHRQTRDHSTCFASQSGNPTAVLPFISKLLPTFQFQRSPVFLSSKLRVKNARNPGIKISVRRRGMEEIASLPRRTATRPCNASTSSQCQAMERKLTAWHHGTSSACLIVQFTAGHNRSSLNSTDALSVSV